MKSGTPQLYVERILAEAVVDAAPQLVLTSVDNDAMLFPARDPMEFLAQADRFRARTLEPGDRVAYGVVLVALCGVDVVVPLLVLDVQEVGAAPYRLRGEALRDAPRAGRADVRLRGVNLRAAIAPPRSGAATSRSAGRHPTAS